MQKIKIREKEGNKEILDEVRKKWVAYTPEEKVRQLFIKYLINKKKYPQSHIAIEYAFTFENGKKQRCDIVVFDSLLKPLIIIECKAENVNITSEVFQQATKYNSFVGAKYIAVTNLLQTFCLSSEDGINYTPCSDFPIWKM